MLLICRKSIAGFPALNGHFDFLSYRVFSRYLRSQVPIFAFLFLASTGLFGQVQTIDDVSKQILLPSPQAASLGKYGDAPVNFHTGGATINIPLYEVKIGSLTVPLSLSYQSSGIRVTDIASRVGLGWTLQGEGVIARTVRGNPDESAMGFSTLFGLLPSSGFSQVNANTVYVSELVAEGIMDSEPDVYHYNFPSNSGKFYVHPVEGIIKVPHNSLMIDPQWTITGDDGTKYFFSKPEYTESTSSSGTQLQYISSWYLTRILTVKNEEVIFNYETNLLPVNYGFTMSETDYFYYLVGGSGTKAPVRTFVNQKTYAARLSSIETRIERVDFIYDMIENGGHGRLDLKDDFRLMGINVVSKLTDQCSRNFSFETHYSGSAAGCDTPGGLPLPNDENAGYRLKLDAVIERSCDGEQLKRHSFVYNARQLPPRCSLDQDHWVILMTRIILL